MTFLLFNKEIPKVQIFVNTNVRIYGKIMIWKIYVYLLLDYYNNLRGRKA